METALRDAMTFDPLESIEVPGWRVETAGEVLSTNSLAAARAAAGEAGGLAVVADHQVAGRGRRGNRWDAPPGAALLLSALLRPSQPVAAWPRLAIAAAVAVCLALEETSPHLKPRIKWPNDILVDGRKLAGILLESQGPDEHHAGWVVVGVGINVHTREFPLNLRYPATSILLACGQAPARAELAARVLGSMRDCFDRAFADWDGLLRDYAARDALAGRRVRVESSQGIHEGIAAGLAHDGALRLERDGQPCLSLHDAHSLVPLD